MLYGRPTVCRGDKNSCMPITICKIIWQEFQWWWLWQFSVLISYNRGYPSWLVTVFFSIVWSGKTELSREKSWKSQGILKWNLSGNPVMVPGSRGPTWRICARVQFTEQLQDIWGKWYGYVYNWSNDSNLHVTTTQVCKQQCFDWEAGGGSHPEEYILWLSTTAL